MILTKEKSDFIIILFGKLLQIIIMIFSIRVSTTLLDPKEMGNVYIFTTIYSFFVLSLISPFGQYVNRHTHKWYQEKSIIDNLMIYFIYVIFISLLSIAIGSILYFFGISNEININIFIFLLFSIILILTLNQTILPLLNMLHYRLSFTVLTVLTSLLSLIFGYIFVKFFGSSAENWLLGTVFSNCIFMIIGFVILRNKLNDKFNGVFYNLKKITKPKIKSILVFVIPLSIATLFMWLQNSGYRIVVEQKLGLEFLGFLGVGMAVSSQIASVVESIVMQYFHPIYYQKITNVTLEDRKKAINELINKVLPIYFMLTIFLTFFAKYIVEILVAEKYFEAYIFAVFGIWIEFFRMTTNLFGNISQSEMNTKKFMIPYIIGSILTIILVYLSSIHSEYKLYLPLALIVGGFLTMIIMYFSMKKLIDFEIDYRLIFWAFIVSIPYFGVYFIDIESTLFNNIVLVMCFGLYFLGTIFYIYKKGLVNDNC